jgi:uncharacterized protein YndB with AHSA1/START domain
MKTFVYSIFIDTTVQKLWEALTSPELSRKYWREHEIHSDWKPGSPILLIKEDGTLNWEGKVLSYDPFSSLSFTFDPTVDQRYRGENISKVTYKLEPSDDVVILTIIHEDMSDKLEAIARVSWAYVASGIKSLLEIGKPLSE